MTWVIPWSRHSARLQRVDDEGEHVIRGYLCDAAIRALILSCPACGALYDIKAGDRRPRVFNRERQRFHCGRCRFAASVYVIVDVGRPPEGRRQSRSSERPSASGSSSARRTRGGAAEGQAPDESAGEPQAGSD